jgi:magnesium chelatase family protein
MSLAIVHSRACIGIQAPEVSVEVHISNGLPKLSIVGLPEEAVKESKDRVRSAIMNSHFFFPMQRITVNLAPADLPKEGGRFDLPIALGILAASGQIPTDKFSSHEFAGELALSGELKAIQGALTVSLGTQYAQRFLVIPQANADEAVLAGSTQVLPAKHILDVCAHLSAQTPLLPYKLPQNLSCSVALPDLAEVRGQYHAKRALEIAAAGLHSLLMVGPPGTGKSMLASRLPGILPEMTDQEALTVAAIASITKRFNPTTFRIRPYRAPHHSASAVALVGGGRPPRPGEISLAHHGILFLDELPEFDRRVLESLREPLETGTVIISRAGQQAEFPAKFQLITAMNPCPCGYLGDPQNHCRCSSEQIERYKNRLSGPLLDRIDMHIDVPRIPEELLTQKEDFTAESSANVKQRIKSAWDKQLQRQNKINSFLSAKDIEKYCDINANDRSLLARAIKQFGLSARAYHRILRLARTIADLENQELIVTNHITEALNYRRIDHQSKC